jgi:hypothetical protein
LKVIKKTALLNPSTIEINTEIWNNQKIIDNLKEISEAIFMVHIKTIHDLEMVLKYRSICKGIVIDYSKQYEFSVDVRNTIKNLIDYSKKNNLLVQTNIIWNSHPGSNNEDGFHNITEILPVIANLADYGSDIIMIDLTEFTVDIEGIFII